MDLTLGFRYKSGAVHTATARAGVTPSSRPLKGRYFVKRAGKRVRPVGAGVAGKKGGDPWVALRPVPLTTVALYKLSSNLLRLQKKRFMIFLYM